MRALCLPALLVALAGCGQGAGGGAEEGKDTAGAAFKMIPCALGEAKDFAPVCKVEETSVEGQTIWIVWHPDGGFRRFREAADGSGLAALDGADAVRQTFAGRTLEITIAGDSYSLPAGARE